MTARQPGLLTQGEGWRSHTLPCVRQGRAGPGFLSDAGPPGRGQVVLRTNHLPKGQLLSHGPGGMASVLTSAPGIA